MAKSDRKLHEARMAGAAWLMNVIKTQGMEAAEKELKVRGAMFVPLEVNQKQLDEAVYKIKTEYNRLYFDNELHGTSR